MRIILAQGNPGSKYTNTRHNVGFLTLDRLAETLGQADWKTSTKFNAHILDLGSDDQRTLLVKPTSYYNDTGLVARAITDFYKIDPKTDLLVIHDDLALPLGTIRTRQKGSDAGNNGIKSLNQHLGQEYKRLRIGIWNPLRDEMNNADFVLSRFSPDERTKLNEQILPKATELILDFIKTGELPDTSYKINK